MTDDEVREEAVEIALDVWNRFVRDNRPHASPLFVAAALVRIVADEHAQRHPEKTAEQSLEHTASTVGRWAKLFEPFPSDEEVLQ